MVLIRALYFLDHEFFQLLPTDRRLRFLSRLIAFSASEIRLLLTRFISGKWIKTSRLMNLTDLIKTYNIQFVGYKRCSISKLIVTSDYQVVWKLFIEKRAFYLRPEFDALKQTPSKKLIWLAFWLENSVFKKRRCKWTELKSPSEFRNGLANWLAGSHESPCAYKYGVWNSSWPN